MSLGLCIAFFFRVDCFFEHVAYVRFAFVDVLGTKGNCYDDARSASVRNRQPNFLCFK